MLEIDDSKILYLYFISVDALPRSKAETMLNFHPSHYDGKFVVLF